MGFKVELLDVGIMKYSSMEFICVMSEIDQRYYHIRSLFMFSLWSHVICHWPRSSIFARKLSFSGVPRINLNYVNSRDDDDVEWTRLFSSCSAFRCSYLRHIRAANSVNLKRPIDAKKNNSISDHNDLGEVDATQNIIISSCFFFFVSLPIISIYFVCRKR